MGDGQWLVPSETILISNSGLAIVQLMEDVLGFMAAAPVEQAMVEHPATYDPKADGAVANAVEQVQGHMRTNKGAPEHKLGKGIHQ